MILKYFKNIVENYLEKKRNNKRDVQLFNYLSSDSTGTILDIQMFNPDIKNVINEKRLDVLIFEKKCDLNNFFKAKDGYLNAALFLIKRIKDEKETLAKNKTQAEIDRLYLIGLLKKYSSLINWQAEIPNENKTVLKLANEWIGNQEEMKEILEKEVLSATFENNQKQKKFTI